MIEQRILAFSLAHPGYEPARIAAELGRPKWGGIRISANGVWGCCAATACPSAPSAWRWWLQQRPARAGAPEPVPVRHIRVYRPGQLVQMDCVFIGRLSGTKGAVWQYTAIDAPRPSSGPAHASARNPSACFTSALAHQVAADLAERGWASRRSAATTAPSSRAASSGQHWRAWTPSTGASTRGAQSNGFVERPSWRCSTSAGGRPSPAT